MEIREAIESDLEGLLKLYTQLHGNPMPEMDDALMPLWYRILNDPNHHIIVLTIDGVIISSCVIVVVLNLTRGQRPYALIENVVTDEKHRNKGCASAVLNYARDIALCENCYKIMLMTGSKLDSTLRFYERAGYNRRDKTAFIQWL
ncbi:MAG: GNAT family N-acetyltransferase [Clostridiales bacterium]|jgi:GNAT superfamily N-acetyltransferase|nr:GNAT family N-acetyltransferase [Clostridiales bacterium]